ncbi:MAG: ATP-binding cassette domain-containing protein, partial [Acidimicrobiia bacterium]
MIATMAGVEKSYGSVRALDGIDLEVPEGSVFGLIGPNGAGKTTSMMVISTLLARDAGKVEVVGVDPQNDPQGVRRVLGYMPDFFGFYDNLTVREYLEFFA